MTGRDLKYIRFRNSMTQEYVASVVGISRFTLSSYESGRTGIPITVSLKLNKLYNLDADDVDAHTASQHEVRQLFAHPVALGLDLRDGVSRRQFDIVDDVA